jgi:hypothetical protein
MPPSPPIQCCVDVWKEKIQPDFSNIDHGGRGEADVLENGQKREKSHYFCSWLSELGVGTQVEEEMYDAVFPLPKK